MNETITLNSENGSSVLSNLPYLQIGSGFIIGLSVGYFIKKSFKLILLLTGMVLVLIFALESQKIITLNEENLSHAIDVGSRGMEHFVLFLKERVDRFNIAGGASAAVGFITGLKAG